MLPPLRGMVWEISAEQMQWLTPDQRQKVLEWSLAHGMEPDKVVAVRASPSTGKARFLVISPFPNILGEITTDEVEVDLIPGLMPMDVQRIGMWWEPNPKPTNETQEAAAYDELKAISRIYNTDGKLVEIIEDDA